MLSYLVKTTVALALAATCLGAITAYTLDKESGNGKRYVLAGSIAGLLLSVVMSYLKNATSRIDTGAWNLRIFFISIAALILFLIFDIRAKGNRVTEAIKWTALSVIAFILLFYTLPDVWAYPYQMISAGQSMVSTDFLFKMIGFVLGWILNIVLYFAVYKCVSRLEKPASAVVLRLLLLINASRQLSVMLQIMLAKRMVTSNHTLFMIAKLTSNYSDWFIYCSIAVVSMVALILWVRSMNVREPYSNPAEHRKIKAKWRNIRRWAATAVIVFLLCVLNMTAVKAYDSKVIELSPVEDAEIRDGNVYVHFEQVNDGHLHRFAYVSDAGTQIRFIVIQKPNSSSYGIGLDACDICGETGYYEKDGQVVCKLCDVVMNINTIGFKGGCNPIVIPYEIEGGSIIVPIDGLLEHESEFK